MSFFNNTSTLGTSTPAKPSGFGNFTFGAPTSTQQPFGQTPAFGAPSSAPSFNFAAPTTSAPALGGFGSFGTATTSAAPSFGGFGTTTTSAPSFGGFGTTATTNAAPAFGGFGTSGGFGGFGTTATTSSAPTFSGFGQTTQQQTGFGGFGTSFGGFGQQKPATTAFGGYSGFGAAQQQQQQPQLTPDEAFTHCIFKVSFFGDERDTTIARWNYLQAMWGTGKAYYSQLAPPVDITPQNYLCRFKAMSYNKIPGKDNKMGHVGLIFNKPVAQIKDLQLQLVPTLNQMLGGNPNLSINIDHVRGLNDEKSQVTIFVEEKSPTTNEVKRITATDLCAYLNQPMTKGQLNNFAIDQIVAQIHPDEDQLKEYLMNPPKGIDPRMWRQAIEDNPDPSKLIPVPVIGFHELKWRTKCQESETEMHNQYLAKVSRDLENLKQRYTSSTAKIMEYRRKFSELSHRILKIIVKQEITRKMGVAMSPEEEILRSKLESMQALVSAPTQFKGRLSELLSQMRMQRDQWSHTGGGNEYKLDKDSTDEMQTFLAMQQKAMALLIETMNKDIRALKLISDGANQLMRG
ncbi:probable nucleoporin Nup54 [Lutzomyia longipalpis]|uniref:probable nucleoporin Nup54 n=1 Tax=Lutzomyia longipalpis TaxID=7200 RepID=UPI0024847054|nr:probable nucleoporin Nup54 [Lutzomyia longipalpis]